MNVIPRSRRHPADQTTYQILVLTQGLHGAGKTHWALAWLKQAPHRDRVNRDQIRAILGFDAGEPIPDQETIVTEYEERMLHRHLRAGRSVVVDDTNLRPDRVARLGVIANMYGARLVVKDFLDVPVETCVQRDSQRGARGGRHVGADVIRSMADRANASAS